MASQSKSRNPTGGNSTSAASGSAFRWDANQAGVIAAAALAGAAVGLAANFGRKLIVQSLGAPAGNWDEALKAEHVSTLALFDQIEATADSQAGTRTALLAKLKYALTRHAHQEESVIYPALREANFTHDADALNSEHGYVKTYLYELEALPNDCPEWLAKLRDFRAMIQEHMRMEEEEVFATFRSQLSDEQNARLTTMMRREGLKLA
ncbi:MAG: hemerythrin domain-containing protein [Sphingosinicella sp.]